MSASGSTDYEDDYDSASLGYESSGSIPATPLADAPAAQDTPTLVAKTPQPKGRDRNAGVGVSDTQRHAIRTRGAIWRAIARDGRIRLTEVSRTLYRQPPQSALQLFLAAAGPYANRQSRQSQTQAATEDQDCQTGSISTSHASCQVPDGLKDELRKTLASARAAVPASASTTPSTAPAPPAALQARTPIPVTAVSSSSGLSTGTLQLLQPDPRPCLITHAAFAHAHARMSLVAVTCCWEAQHVHAKAATLEIAKRPSQAAAPSGVVVWDAAGGGAAPAFRGCSESHLTCCAWGPGSAPLLLLTGAEDASVCLWDVGSALGAQGPRAAAAAAHSPPAPDGEAGGSGAGVALQRPAVHLNPVVESGDSAAGPVVCLQVMPGCPALSGDCARQAAFDVAAALQSGCVCIWTVQLAGARAGLDVRTAWAAAAGPAPFGARAATRVRVPTVASQPAHSPSVPPPPPQLHSLAACALSPGCFFVGACTGVVHKLHCYGGRAAPQVLSPTAPAARLRPRPCRHAPYGVPVVALDMHAGLPGLCLASFNDGLVAAFWETADTPVATWGFRPGLLAALWLPGYPSVFVAVHDTGDVCVVETDRAEGARMTWHAVTGGKAVTSAAAAPGAWGDGCFLLLAVQGSSGVLFRLAVPEGGGVGPLLTRFAPCNAG